MNMITTKDTYTYPGSLIKKLGFVSVFLLICGAKDLYAQLDYTTLSDKENTNKKPWYQEVVPSALYSYSNLKFNSTTGSNYNRFSGYSNFYALSGDNIKLPFKLFAGVLLFKVNTAITSQNSISPSVPSITNQSTNNNTLFVHALRPLTDTFYIDAAGAYGQNKISNQIWIIPDVSTQNSGYSNGTSSNWFTILSALYRKEHMKFIFSGNMRLMYSQTSNDASTMVFPSQDNTQTIIIPSLVNKAGYVIENIELAYSLTPEFRPFVDGGLIQVAYYSNSRPTIGAVVNGSIPQLYMNKNGYKLGAGLEMNRKHYTLRLDQQYFNSANTFINNQTTITFKYLFS
jgi:hypothetical protein